MVWPCQWVDVGEVIERGRVFCFGQDPGNYRKGEEEACGQGQGFGDCTRGHGAKKKRLNGQSCTRFYPRLGNAGLKQAAQGVCGVGVGRAVKDL